MRALIGTALVGLALLACQGRAQAEDYPARAVTVVSPYAAGGGIDLLARLLAARLEQRLGRPFVIPPSSCQVAACDPCGRAVAT